MKECTIMGVPLYELDEYGPAGIRLYQVRKDTYIHGIRVPAGYKTNGASIPRGLRSFINPHGILFRAAVMHDYLYSTKCFSRKKSDEKFKEVVLIDSGSVLFAQLAYMGVRLGGQSAWGPAPVGI